MLRALATAALTASLAGMAACGDDDARPRRERPEERDLTGRLLDCARPAMGTPVRLTGRISPADVTAGRADFEGLMLWRFGVPPPPGGARVDIYVVPNARIARGAVRRMRERGHWTLRRDRVVVRAWDGRRPTTEQRAFLTRCLRAA